MTSILSFSPACLLGTTAPDKPRIDTSLLYIKHLVFFVLCQAWVKPLIYVKSLLQVKPRTNYLSLLIKHWLFLLCQAFTLRQTWVKPLFYVKSRINSSSLYIKHRLSLCQAFTLRQAWVKPLFYVKSCLH